ncbi:MAG TPA: hypothetical protein PKO06_15095 [Candidatus Ozemobacteraceae bacterium]|nr:hypothetical protein [Candidatus Ozemobacteraceae bacterium]
MRLSREQAYYILTNLDTFVTQFESATQKKVTPGALQIIHEILTDISFPAAVAEQTRVQDTLH